MATRVLSVFSYVVAGFFVYAVAVIAFFKAPSLPMKLLLLGIFCVPVILALCIGFALANNGRKLRDTGIVLLSGAGVTVFVVATYACLLATEEFRAQLPPETREMISSYAFGFGFLAALLLAGTLLVWCGLKQPTSVTS